VDAPAGVVASSPDRFNRANVTLRDLIRDAYGVSNARISGGPDWMTSTRYDVAARASFTPSAEEMALLVRNLLTERFALKVHPEKRDLPVYLLSPSRDDGRRGPRLSPTTADCAAIKAERTKNGDAPPRVPPRPGEPPLCATFVSTRVVTSPTGSSVIVRYQTSGTTLAQFAEYLPTLENALGRVVLDRSGLDGDFDIDLEFSRAGARVNGVVADDPGISIFTALREQLGLQLEATRAPVDILVVDSAERPLPD
jgi:uncharacterized protein (TIGR03435 family)